MSRRSGRIDSGTPPAKKGRFVSSDEESSENEMDQSQNPDFITPNSTEAEVGIIERVTLKNFMCHSRLEFNFGPNVNFIVGRNGSGKSAVLTAMVVGLGGKATVTNRGSSVKAFIKDGQSTAEVAIKLRNRGTDAFKSELYGNSIVVERKLSADGGTQYKLKSTSGKIVSTKREELSHILDQFNIQVDNPVSILNQDTSRNFLHSKNPHDKYKFFLKATQLEQMTSDYNTIQEQKILMEQTVKKREEGLPDLEKEVLSHEQKFKDLGSIETLRENKRKLQQAFAWAQIHEMEKELEPLNKQIRTEEARIPKFDQKVKESQEKADRCSSRWKAIQDELNALSESVKEIQPEHKEATNELQEQKKKLKTVQNDVRKIHNQLKNIEKDKQQLEERINEMRNTAQQDYEAERQEREKQIMLLVEQLDKLMAQQATNDHQLDQFNKAINHAKEQSYSVKTRETDCKTTIDNLQRRLKTLQSSRNNRLSLFGNWVPGLLKEIDELYHRRRFRKKPFGPVGAYLKLQDPKWALGVESCLKGLVHSYCCDNHDDDMLLKELLKKYTKGNRFTPSVITCPFENSKYDISGGAVHPSRYPSFLDIVQVDNPVIYNCIIDQRRVESVLLIADNQDARTCMRTCPPQNCREAFTLVGDQVHAGAEQRYYSSNYDKARYISADVEQQITETQRELSVNQAEYERLRRQSNEFTNSLKSNTVQKNKAQTQRMKTQELICKVQFDINELRNYEEAAPVDVTTLEEEVGVYEDQMDKLTQQKQTAEKDMEKLKNNYKEAIDNFEKVDKKFKELAEKVEPLKDDLNRAHVDVETAKQHKQHYEGKRRDHNAKIVDLKKQYAREEKKTEEATKKAREICPERIDTRRTASNIDSEITQVERRILAEQKKNGDPAEITRQYKESQDRFVRIKQEIKNFTAVVKKFEQMLAERRRAYVRFRQSIAVRAKWYFITMLSERGFSGKMKFSHPDQLLNISKFSQMLAERQRCYNSFQSYAAIRAKYLFVQMLSERQIDGKLEFKHRKQQLDIQVQPTQGESMIAKDMKALSGGERSFSTVCFIMALWEAMDSPFRALDEFDVFMDMVNRRISMDMMLKVARDQKMRQFIFLTPQDMSKVTGGPLVRISRMHDPERGQGTLPYGEAREDDEDQQ